MSKVYGVVLAVGCLCLAGVVAGSSATAAVPGQMNFQGILLDDDLGTVVDSTYLIRFTIYDDSTGGAALWTEDQTVATENGLFNTFFGINNPVPGSIFDGIDRWLEIELIGVGVYEPRNPIGTVAYAYRVESVNGATGGDIYGDITLHSTLTVGDLDGNAGVLQLTDGDSVTLIIDGTEDFVIMPDSSIPATDIINETGIAADFESAEQTLAQGATDMSDLATVTITIPTDGYLVVQGRCVFRAESYFWQNVVRVQIDETAGGPLDVTHYSEAGAYLGDDIEPDSRTSSLFNLTRTLYTDRVYYKEAGTYTFRLEGRAHENNPGGAISTIHNAFVTATFHPTSYGPVETTVSAGDASQFDEATLIPLSAELIGTNAVSGYSVDLRELELRSARLQAELERTRRELAEARLRQQANQQ
ncbi:MAG: hypothetical protein GF341_04890 [candidate division Zixibacteria bacterium]|nr:hypothetical protein [candidate division Zixibacteria bacterium]